ncbi:hypothetical protein [Streptomyces sp.]|uniref:hypothetical protein n=1 Tax=Streptomyces sp. TaxID=1931 RepID=UPI002F402F72
MFFDYFLAGLALGYANGGDVRRFYRLLTASEWRPAMVKRVVSELPGMKLQSLLAGFDLTAGSQPLSRGFASLNLGSLWSTMIRMTKESGYLPEDHRLKWAWDYEDEWKPFVDALVAAELASRTPLSTSGSRKMRVRLRIGPSKILLEDSNDPRVQLFWTSRRDG